MTSQRVPWSMVAMLSATATASYICRVNVSTAGALLMEEFQMTQVEMGRIFSAFLLGYAFFQIPAGVLADRFGVDPAVLSAPLITTLVDATGLVIYFSIAKLILRV